MRRGLGSLLAVCVVSVLSVLVLGSGVALARGSGSRTARSDAQITKGSLGSAGAGGIVRVVPGEGYDSPGGSTQVRALQVSLARAGDPPGPIDGRYGPLTEQAVGRLQAADGVPVDGIPSVVTVASLSGALFPSAGYGSSGGSMRVRALQRSLARVGDAPGPIDGRYGPLTEQAVRRFQVAHGLRVSGIAGPGTITHLAPDTIAHRIPKAPDRVAPKAPARVAPQSAQTPAVAGARRGGSSSSSGWLWLVLVGLVLGLVVFAWSYTRERRAARRGERLIPSPATESDNRPPGLEQDPSTLDQSVGVLGGVNGDQGHAEVGYRRADQRGDATGALNLGLLLEARRDLAGAEAAFARADRRGDGLGAFNLGLLLLESRNDMAGAEAAFARADQRGDAKAAFNLAVLLSERGDLAGAEAAYRRADQRGLPAGASGLGALLSQRGDLAGAETAYRRADQRGDANGAFSLAVMLRERGDAGAEAAYRRADQRGDARAASGLALLLSHRGDLAGAQAAYQRAEQRRDHAAATIARGPVLDPHEHAHAHAHNGTHR